MSLRWLLFAVALTDFLALVTATGVAMLTKFGWETDQRTWGPFELTYPEFGLALTALWWLALTVSESRAERILGEGVEEYRRLGRATVLTFGTVAVFSVLVKLDFSRGYIAVALPAGVLGLLVSRLVWRMVIRRERARGFLTVPVLVVGPPAAGERVGAVFAATPHSGYRVAGMWDPTAAVGAVGVGEVAGSDPTSLVEPLVAEIERCGARAVVVSDPALVGHDGLRSLSWRLDGVQVYVLPHLAGIAPERVELVFVAGESLVRMEAPQFARAGGLLKSFFDRCVALLLLALTAPLLLVIACAVRCSSPGPILFSQKRIGRNGEEFTLWKFRSMRVGADAELDDLLRAGGTVDVPLFKPENDERVTPVGRVLRRLSLDELPQLFNVVNGTMSLVGPRPQVAAEVALYRGYEELRLTVRPGLTGLWQVSGRSSLSWQEAARLDVYYVENWSMLVDLVILWRTIGAVIKGEGAR